MSLFGTSPDDGPPSNRDSRTTSSLFADDDHTTPGFGGSSSSLFNDDDHDAGTSSPWGSNNPAPKRAARRGRELVKTLLRPGDVPEEYVDAFDGMLRGEGGGGGEVSVEGVKRMRESTGLDEDVRKRILGMVVGGEEEEVGRVEFNVLFALMGLALDGEDATYDGVDERRKSEFLFLNCLMSLLLLNWPQLTAVRAG